jgi:hypothetical protein
MRTLLVLLLFLAQPFWETKPPETWTDADIDILLQSSPWVATARPEPAVRVYFATAAPMELAEARFRKRSKLPAPDPDYVDFLAEHRAGAFVLAIPYPTVAGAEKGGETKRMQDETEMKIGRKSYKLLGLFPPTPSDPVLRLVFPRAAKPTDKTVEFKLYLANLPFPERDVSFFVKDLFYRGNLEM